MEQMKTYMQNFSTSASALALAYLNNWTIGQLLILPYRSTVIIVLINQIINNQSVNTESPVNSSNLPAR
jgi:hypothetical protein